MSFLQKLCIFTFIGLFIFFTDVHFANAASVLKNGTHHGRQNQKGNHFGVGSPLNDEYQQQLQNLERTKRASPLENLFHLPDAFGKVVGNVLTGAHNLIDNINPLKPFFSGNVSPVTRGNPAKPRANSFKGKQIRRIATTAIPKNTSPVHEDLLGNILGGAENIFDTALGIKPQTTTPAQIRKTVAPPPGGHGRGVPAVIFNIKNILENALALVGAILHWNEHPEPGYITSKIKSSEQSAKALVDIYLQRNLEGGIGDIPVHIWEILKSIGSLSDTFKHNNSGNIFALLASGQTLLKSFGKLREDFEEPVSTTPIPGGLIGGFLHGLSLIIPHNNPNTPEVINQTSLQERYGAFGNVVWNTGKLIDALKDIDETLERYHPNNTILQFIEKVEDSAELSLANNTLDDENILDVIQKVWFPNMTLAEMIGYFGKTLKKISPNFAIAQIIGDLLQQKLFVDLGLNILVRKVNFLRFGNIKSVLLHTTGIISDDLLGRSLNGLLADGIGILEKVAEAIEWFLKTFHSILDWLSLKLKGGVYLRHGTAEGPLHPKFNSTGSYEYSVKVRHTRGPAGNRSQ
ncbi:hypothetical protein B7P43_G01373 [Cryptotermes secundus]|uniref:Secreted protein n=1 Tax=Cryptotermes secundus TaxID=105785 RepID=A0A2J7PRD6_9NEOP|nr:uncharacterized protein LOC111872283 isoform X1 [Cryptotermes secundus]PNF18892.1 hypothetical protein B7P43_G01373 [Cryptotermes secundus]